MSHPLETSPEDITQTSRINYTPSTGILITTSYQDEPTSHIEQIATTGHYYSDKKDTLYGMQIFIIIFIVIVIMSIIMTVFIICMVKFKCFNRSACQNNMSRPIYRPANMENIQMFELENMSTV